MLPMSTMIFDMDGTLIDSMPYFSRMVLQLLQHEGIPYPPDIVKIVTPLGYSGTAKKFIELGSCQTEAQLVSRFTQALAQDYAQQIPLKDHVKDFLIARKAAGDTLAVLTASPHSATDSCLQRCGVYHLFDTVWSCEDFGLTKSQPEIFLRAARQLGVAPEDILFFDDNLFALGTAKAAGLQTVGVYDASSEESKENIRQTADRYIHSFGELL